MVLRRPVGQLATLPAYEKRRLGPAAFACISFCVAAGVSAPTSAQQAPSTGFDPRQTEKRFDIWQSEQGQPQRTANLRRVTGAPGPASPKPLFNLRTVHVTGATAVPAGDIATIYEPYLGKMVSQADLVAIAAGISDLYRARGYHLSRAIVPPQDIDGGRVRIQVVEGRIVEVAVAGDRADHFGIPQLLAPLREQQPAQLGTLERQLLLINERPGVRVVDTAVDEIGPASGRFRLSVKVQTWSVFTSFGFDNLGSRAVGPWQGFATAAYNSMLAPGDSLAVNFSTVPDTPRELSFGRLSYDVPVGTDGLRFGATALHSEVQPGDYRREFNDRTVTNSVELRTSIIPIQRQAESLSLTLATGFSNVSEADNFGKIYDDHIRTVGLTADYRLRDTFGGTNYLTLAYRKGLDIFGASQTDDFVSRAGAAPTFAMLGGWFTRYQPLTDAWSVKFSAAGQAASGPLYTSQQFYLGGAAFGRGYGSAEISGDNGVAGSAELRFDQSLSAGPLRGYQVYGFVESGAVWNSGYGINQGLSLTSAGGGVRFFLADNLTAGVGFAYPLTYRPPENPDRHPRLLFSLSNSFRLCPERAWARCS